MNSVNLIGNLTRDPDTRETKGRTRVCTLRLAVSARSKQADPVYVDVVAFDRQAENCDESQLREGHRDELVLPRFERPQPVVLEHGQRCVRFSASCNGQAGIGRKRRDWAQLEPLKEPRQGGVHGVERHMGAPPPPPTRHHRPHGNTASQSHTLPWSGDEAEPGSSDRGRAPLLRAPRATASEP